MLKIRRPLGRLIFNMGIAIPGKTVFLIETAPRYEFLGFLVTMEISECDIYTYIKTWRSDVEIWKGFTKADYYIHTFIWIPYNQIQRLPKRSSWRHQTEIFTALQAFFVGNSPVTGEFPTQRPVARRCIVFLDLRMNKLLSKQLKRNVMLFDHYISRGTGTVY